MAEAVILPLHFILLGSLLLSQSDTSNIYDAPHKVKTVKFYKPILRAPLEAYQVSLHAGKLLRKHVTYHWIPRIGSLKNV